MICWSAERRMTDYIDGRLRRSERSRLEKHLNECPSCSAQAEQLGYVRAALGELIDPTVPGHLRTSLRVQASREREAVILSHGSRWNRLWRRWKFQIDEFMRPLTIPATGGLIFSLILFAGLTFTISSSNPMVT
jgi:anti-sigma factor RsiW